MGWFMTWEQFGIFMDVVQKHLVNTHHLDTVLTGLAIGIPGLIILNQVRKHLRDLVEIHRNK